MCSVDKGELQVSDFQTIVNIARLKWITKVTEKTEAPWRQILEYYLEGLNIELNVVLYSDYDVKSLGLFKNSCILPTFYK